MTFGWEGFSLNHPEEWAPVVLVGNRREGYVRIASPARLSIQIRWRRLKNAADAEGFLNSYVTKLARDARRAGIDFNSSRETVDDRLTYRYSGTVSARGLLFQPTEDGRAFVMEVVSSNGDPKLPILRHAAETFRTSRRTDRWSLFGLDLSLPFGLRVERREFLAGKTTLDWQTKRTQVHAERWGFADQLLARYSLGSWAKALLRVDDADIAEEPLGLRLRLPGKLWKSGGEALVQHQPQRNQIVVVRVDGHDASWRPKWDWLN